MAEAPLPGKKKSSRESETCQHERRTLKSYDDQKIQDERIIKVTHLITEACAKVEQLTPHNPGEGKNFDSIHRLVQILQWQLGLAKVGPAS